MQVLTKELNVTVVALSRVDVNIQGLMNKTPMLSNLLESGTP